MRIVGRPFSARVSVKHRTEGLLFMSRSRALSSATLDPNVRMQNSELFWVNHFWLSWVQSALPCPAGLGATSSASSTLLHSVRTREIPATLGSGQGRCFVESGPGCEASPTRTAVKGAALRAFLSRGHLVLTFSSRLPVKRFLG